MIERPVIGLGGCQLGCRHDGGCPEMGFGPAYIELDIVGSSPQLRTPAMAEAGERVTTRGGYYPLEEIQADEWRRGTTGEV
ncbi:hypothetical protein GUJ93_ZPchr0007g3056 [Zizania palustris]|uniref:Uncharacterized protein n=1 Tax=Zizania palustris TaxID=103762 RepID=A0A8J5TIU0_ZIZPA|nr:hypothetical protein GUJ93_ZPchr0007g3056 [Zizania palustris]